MSGERILVSREPTFGPAAVARAAGVSRPTFHSWVARGYLPLAPEGPGMGRERQFTLLDAVRIAAVGQLNRLAATVSAAGKAAGMIDDRVLEKPQEGYRWVLVTVPASEQPDEAAPRVGTTRIMRVGGAADMERDINLRMGDPMTFIVIDLTRLAVRTAEALAEIA